MDITLRTRTLGFISGLLSDKTLTKKAYLNTVASMLEYATTLLVGFFLTPFMVIGLGDYAFGLWQVLTRLIGYLSPASGRPTHALKWTLANQQVSSDYEQKRRHVGSALVVWLIFLPVLLVLGCVVAWFAPSWIKAPAGFVWTIRIVSLVLVTNMILSALTHIPQGVLQGVNLGYKRMGITSGLILFGGGITWLALYLDTGIIGVSLSVFAKTVLMGVIFLLIVRQYISWFGVAKPSIEEVRVMFGRSGWFLGWNMVMTLMMASDVVVLGFFNSVTSVTDYSLTKYVPEMIISIIANVIFAIMPGMGGIIGSGDLKRAARLRSEMMSFIWLFVTTTGASILLLNRSFVELWVGADRYSGSLPHLLIVVGVMQLVFIRIDANIIDLTLRLSQKVILGLLSVSISVISASVLVGYLNMGIVGLCLGMMSGRLILSAGYPLLISRFLDIILMKQLKSMVRPVLVTVALFGMTIFIDKFHSALTWPGAQSWIGFSLYAGLTGIVMSAVSFFAGLTAKQREIITRRVTIVFSRSYSNKVP